MLHSSLISYCASHGTGIYMHLLRCVPLSGELRMECVCLCVCIVGVRSTSHLTAVAWDCTGRIWGVLGLVFNQCLNVWIQHSSWFLVLLTNRRSSKHVRWVFLQLSALACPRDCFLSKQISAFSFIFVIVHECNFFSTFKIVFMYRFYILFINLAKRFSPNQLDWGVQNNI